MRPLRFTAFATLLCFTINQLAAPSELWASERGSFSAESEVSIFRQFQLSLPPELAHVQTIFSGKGPTLIHIQTAHGNYEAQKKIQAILHYLTDQYQFRLLLLEGSASQLKPETLNFFPSQTKLNSEILDDLMHEALMKGTELYLTEEKNTKALGVEDRDVYTKNGESFRSVIRRQNVSSSFFEDFDAKIEQLAGLIVNRKLRAFVKEEQRYEENAASLSNWVEFLKAQAAEILDIDLKNPSQQFQWPMLVRLFKLKKIESEFNQESFVRERQEFLIAIRPYFRSTENAQVFSQINTLLLSPLSQSSLPDPDTGLLFERMIALLPRGFDFSGYPQVKYFIAHLILQSEIKAGRLLLETEQLTGMIAKKLAGTPGERNWLRLYRDSLLVKKLLKLELTPGEYEQMVSAKESYFRPSILMRRWRSLFPKKEKIHFDFQTGRLFDTALDFYRGAKERDQIMIRNIESQLRASGEKKAVIVTGGFHAGPFSEYFKEQGYNYALVSPKITTTEGRKAYLNAALLGEAAVSSSHYELPHLSDPDRARLGADAIAESRKIGRIVMQRFSRNGLYPDMSGPFIRIHSEPRDHKVLGRVQFIPGGLFAQNTEMLIEGINFARSRANKRSEARIAGRAQLLISVDNESADLVDQLHHAGLGQLPLILRKLHNNYLKYRDLHLKVLEKALVSRRKLLKGEKNKKLRRYLTTILREIRRTLPSPNEDVLFPPYQDPQSAPDVAVIIPIYNRQNDARSARKRESLIDNLKSLQTLDYPREKIHILVVDNGSEDKEFAAQIKQQFPGVHIIRSSVNLGFAGGNNLGIRYAREKFNAAKFWLLNDDTYVVDPKILTKMLRVSEMPGTGLVGVPIVHPKRRQWIKRSFGLAVPVKSDQHDSAQQYRRMDAVQGSSFLVSDEVIRQLKTGTDSLLDPRFFLYWEETDANARALHSGFRNMLARKTRIVHREEGGSTFSSHSAYYMVRNAFLYSLKNLNGFYFRVVWPLRVFVGYVGGVLLRDHAHRLDSKLFIVASAFHGLWDGIFRRWTILPKPIVTEIQVSFPPQEMRGTHFQPWLAQGDDSLPASRSEARNPRPNRVRWQEADIERIQQFVQSTRGPKLILIGGSSGVGKTTLFLKLRDELKLAPFPFFVMGKYLVDVFQEYFGKAQYTDHKGILVLDLLKANLRKERGLERFFGFDVGYFPVFLKKNWKKLFGNFNRLLVVEDWSAANWTLSRGWKYLKGEFKEKFLNIKVLKILVEKDTQTGRRFLRFFETTIGDERALSLQMYPRRARSEARNVTLALGENADEIVVNGKIIKLGKAPTMAWNLNPALSEQNRVRVAGIEGNPGKLIFLLDSESLKITEGSNASVILEVVDKVLGLVGVTGYAKELRGGDGGVAVVGEVSSSRTNAARVLATNLNRGFSNWEATTNLPIAAVVNFADKPEKVDVHYGGRRFDADAANREEILNRLEEALSAAGITVERRSEARTKESLKFDLPHGLIDAISELPGHGLVITGGPSGTGKSSVLHALEPALISNGRNYAPIEVDHYPVSEQKRRLANGGINNDHLFSFNRDDVVADVKTLLAGEEVMHRPPFYDRSQPARTSRLRENDLIVVDGLHVLHPFYLRQFPTTPIVKIYIDTPWQLRFMRRLLRDMGVRRMRDPFFILQSWENVMNSEKKFVVPTKRYADFVVLTGTREEALALGNQSQALRELLKKDSRVIANPNLMEILDHIDEFLREVVTRPAGPLHRSEARNISFQELFEYLSSRYRNEEPVRNLVTKIQYRTPQVNLQDLLNKIQDSFLLNLDTASAERLSGYLAEIQKGRSEAVALEINREFNTAFNYQQILAVLLFFIENNELQNLLAQRKPSGIQEAIKTELKIVFVHPLLTHPAEINDWRVKDRVFDGDGKRFDNALLLERGAETLSRLNIHSQDSLIDTGVGEFGGFSILAALLGAHVVAIERHHPYAEALREKVGQYKELIAGAKGSVEIIEGDILDASVQEKLNGRKFKHVIATDLVTPSRLAAEVKAPLVWQPDQVEKVLALIAKLKNDEAGSLLFSVPEFYSVQDPQGRPLRYLSEIPFLKPMILGVLAQSGTYPKKSTFVSVPYSMGLKRGVLYQMEVTPPELADSLRQKARRSEARLPAGEAGTEQAQPASEGWIEKEAVVAAAPGTHILRAQAILAAVIKYSSDTQIELIDDRDYHLRLGSLIELTSSGIYSQQRIIVRARGPRNREAVEEIKQILEAQINPVASFRDPKSFRSEARVNRIDFLTATPGDLSRVFQESGIRSPQTALGLAAGLAGMRTQIRSRTQLANVLANAGIAARQVGENLDINHFAEKFDFSGVWQDLFGSYVSAFDQQDVSKFGSQKDYEWHKFYFGFPEDQDKPDFVSLNTLMKRLYDAAEDDQELAEILNAVNQLWKDKGWQTKYGRFLQLFIISQKIFMPLDEYRIAQRRIIHAVKQAGNPEDRLWARWFYLTASVYHLRGFGLHLEIPQDSPQERITIDQDLMVEITRDFLPEYSAWRREHADELTQKGTQAFVVNRAMLWMLGGVMDYRIYDSENFSTSWKRSNNHEKRKGHFPYLADPREKFPKGAAQSIPHYLLPMLQAIPENEMHTILDEIVAMHNEDARSGHPEYVWNGHVRRTLLTMPQILSAGKGLDDLMHLEAARLNAMEANTDPNRHRGVTSVTLYKKDPYEALHEALVRSMSLAELPGNLARYTKPHYQYRWVDYQDAYQRFLGLLRSGNFKELPLFITKLDVAQESIQVKGDRQAMQAVHILTGILQMVDNEFYGNPFGIREDPAPDWSDIKPGMILRRYKPIDLDEQDKWGVQIVLAAISSRGADALLVLSEDTAIRLLSRERFEREKEAGFRLITPGVTDQAFGEPYMLLSPKRSEARTEPQEVKWDDLRKPEFIIFTDNLKSGAPAAIPIDKMTWLLAQIAGFPENEFTVRSGKGIRIYVVPLKKRLGVFGTPKSYVDFDEATQSPVLYVNLNSINETEMTILRKEMSGKLYGTRAADFKLSPKPPTAVQPLSSVAPVSVTPAARAAASPPKKAGVSGLRVATRDEVERILRELDVEHKRGRKAYYSRFVSALEKMNPNVPFHMPSETGVDPVKFSGIGIVIETRGEEKIIHVLRKHTSRVIPSPAQVRTVRENNDPKKEKLMSALFGETDIANVTPIRFLSHEEAADLKQQGLDVDPANLQEYYLQRVMIESNIQKPGAAGIILPVTDAIESSRLLFILNILMRKFDPHLANFAYPTANSIPVSLDNDVVLAALQSLSQAALSISEQALENIHGHEWQAFLFTYLNHTIFTPLYALTGHMPFDPKNRDQLLNQMTEYAVQMLGQHPTLAQELRAGGQRRMMVVAEAADKAMKELLKSTKEEIRAGSFGFGLIQSELWIASPNPQSESAFRDSVREAIIPAIERFKNLDRTAIERAVYEADFPREQFPLVVGLIQLYQKHLGRDVEALLRFLTHDEWDFGLAQLDQVQRSEARMLGEQAESNKPKKLTPEIFRRILDQHGFTEVEIGSGKKKVGRKKVWEFVLMIKKDRHKEFGPVKSELEAAYGSDYEIKTVQPHWTDIDAEDRGMWRIEINYKMPPPKPPKSTQRSQRDWRWRRYYRSEVRSLRVTIETTRQLRERIFPLYWENRGMEFGRRMAKRFFGINIAYAGTDGASLIPSSGTARDRWIKELSSERIDRAKNILFGNRKQEIALSSHYGMTPRNDASLRAKRSNPSAVGYVVGSAFAINYGGLATLRNILGESPIVVLYTKDEELVVIKKFNAEVLVPRNRAPILFARKVDAAVEQLNRSLPRRKTYQGILAVEDLSHWDSAYLKKTLGDDLTVMNHTMFDHYAEAAHLSEMVEKFRTEFLVGSAA